MGASSGGMTRGSIGEAEGPVSPPRFMGAGDARNSKGLGTKSARHVDGRMTTRDDRRSGQTTRARDAFDPERRLEGTTRSRRRASGRGTWTTPPFGRRSGAAGERDRSHFSIRREKATLGSRSPDARATAPPGRLDRIRSTRTLKGDGSVEATTRERARPCAGRQPALGGRNCFIRHEQFAFSRLFRFEPQLPVIALETASSRSR